MRFYIFFLIKNARNNRVVEKDFKDEKLQSPFSLLIKVIKIIILDN